MSLLMKIPLHYANMLPSNQRFHIYSLVSNFDIVESVLCKIGADFIETSGLASTLNSYLKWVLEESKVWHYPSSQDV